jgi:predicted transcriptional regulator
MTTQRLALDRTKSKTTKRFHHAIKTQGQNTPRAESFRNPLLGIEVNLLKRLADVTSQYHSTSYHVRNVLLNAIEDVARTGIGFERVLLRVVEQWKPIDPSEDGIFQTDALTELFRMQRSCREVADHRQNQSAKVQNLWDQIHETEAMTQQYLKDITEMKNRLNTGSDLFALPRKLNRTLGELQQSFVDIFNPPRNIPSSDEIQALEAENIELRRQKLQQEIELTICQHITRRLEFTNDEVEKY